jgi:hypothetical protein
LQEQVTEDFYGASNFTAGEGYGTMSLLAEGEEDLDNETSAALQE